MNRSNGKYLNALALVFGVAIALLLGELLLELHFGKNESYCMHDRGISIEVSLPAELLYGVATRFHYSTNQQGMRGEDYPHMAPDEERSLVFGFIGDPRSGDDRSLYAAAALSEGMCMYNQTLLQVCRDAQVECLDLAALLPQNLEVFYDDCHLTEYGADLVAQAVAEYLRQREPFSASCRAGSKG